MTNPANLLLTAVVSLAIGVGGTYATMLSVVTTCSVAAPMTIQPEPPSHFFDAPLPPPTGGPRY